MYRYPPGISLINIAVIAGTASGTFLAAPGAGLAYRLVAWVMGIPRNPGAAAGMDFVLNDSIGGRLWQVNGFVATGLTSMHINFPPPGILSTANSAITCQVISTVAGGTATVGVMYYTTTL